MQLIAKGAEAELRREGGTLVKERITKGYRLHEIDEKLRKRRTTTEARLLREARRAGVKTPQILEENATSIRMEFIDGEKVKDVLNGKNCEIISEKIGVAVAKLHSYNIIHGDLTTSNMIIVAERKDDPRREKEPFRPSIWFIDFGLGFFSRREEDKAVDLYLLHEALESTHFSILDEAWDAVLDAYKEHYPGSNKVIKALLNVEKRGRYKERRFGIDTHGKNALPQARTLRQP